MIFISVEDIQKLARITIEEEGDDVIVLINPPNESDSCEIFWTWDEGSGFYPIDDKPNVA